MASPTNPGNSSNATPPNGQSNEAQLPPDLDLPPYRENLKRRRSPSKISSSNRKRSSKEIKYAGWPDDLIQAHSLIRRMIRPVVGYRAPTDAEVEAKPNELVLDLCRKHPTLATEKFLCHNKNVELTPLKFLIHNKASVEVISGFCESFPQALQQLDGKNDFFNLDGYPLHLACTIRQNDGDLIAVIAKAYPPAVSTPNEGGFLPLHLLLEYRGFTPALKAVQALVEIYPQAAIQKPPSNHPPPVFSILSSGQLTLEHMECIYSRLPRDVRKLDFPPNCFRDDCFHIDHAQTIARVLPQIQELNLQPPQWTPEAWLFFVQSCQQHASSLRRLALKPPALRQGIPPEVRTALFRFLHGCTGLEMLDLQASTTAATPAVNNRVGVIVPDLTAPIAHLVAHGRLVSLRVVGFNLTARPILEALYNNTLLKHLVLHGLIPPTNANEVLHLSSVLEQRNVTLQHVQTLYSMIALPPLEVAKIQYYTRLNRLGRAAARDFRNTTVQQIAQMLLATQMDPELRAAHPREGLGILYGLLRESPGLWSNTVSSPPNGNTTTGRKGNPSNPS